jgi:DNA-binding MarR family transcriptional regulator
MKVTSDMSVIFTDTNDEVEGMNRSSDEFRNLTQKALAEVAPESDSTAMDLGLTLIRVGNMLQNDLDVNVNRPAGVSWAAFRVLFVLRATGPVTPKRLAKLSNTTPASISSVLSTLTQEGLVTRSSAPHDGRSLIISLSKEGNARVAPLIEANNRRMTGWAELLSAEERALLVPLLFRLLAGTPLETES